MSEKHDPETTPLPAPLPGLSVEIEAISSSPDLSPLNLPGVAEPTPPTPPAPVILPAAAPAARPASAAVAPAPAPHVAADLPDDEKEKTDPELSPVAAKSGRGQMWWIIGGLALFALGVGSGALIWQPGGSVTPPPITQPPPVALPPVPSPPVEVTPIAPPPANTTAPLNPPPTSPTAQPTNPTAQPTSPAEVPPVAAPSSTLPTIPTTPAANPPPPPAANPIAANPPPAPAPNQPLAAANTGSKPRPAPVVAKPAPIAAKPVSPPVHNKPASPPVVATHTKPALEVPPPPPPLPVPSGPQKQLSQATIRSMMLSSESGWKSCVKDAFGSNLTFGIVVGAGGQVQKADILGPLAQSSTGRCILNEIRRLHFPPFTEGGATKQFFWSYQIPAN